jgi:transposase-like protein
MSRPRENHVPTVTKVCPTHGETEFRVHKIGLDKNGNQRYRARCPQCHSDVNAASAKALKFNVVGTTK